MSEMEVKETYTEQPARPVMTYVKTIEDLKLLNSGPLYTQYFTYDNFAKASKTPAMELYDKGEVDMNDIKVLEFIFEAQFSTEEQISRWCEIQGIENGKERVHIYQKLGLINPFFIAIYNKNKANVKRPSEALMFYCIRPMAKYLIEEYSDRLYVEWEAGDNLSGVKKIANRIIINDIYLDTISVKTKPAFWTFNAEYHLREHKIKPPFSCGYVKENKKDREYMVYDIIRMDDNLSDIHEKIQRWEELFVRTKIWMKTFIYTKQYPMLVFITDNDSAAYTLAEQIGLTSKLETYLITTIDRIQNKAMGDAGRFLKYNKEDKTLYEIQYKLFS